MSNTPEQQFTDAISQLGLPIDVFVRLEVELEQQVLDKAKATFVENEPRSWWLSLKVPFISFDYSDGSGLDNILKHIPPGDQRCWFIPETEQKTLPVYDADVRFIGSILRQCQVFEYYLVGKDFSWLIVENDHNQILLCLVPLGP